MRIKTSWVALSVVVLSVGLLLWLLAERTCPSARGSNRPFRNSPVPPGMTVSAGPTAPSLTTPVPSSAPPAPTGCAVPSANPAPMPSEQPAPSPSSNRGNTTGTIRDRAINNYSNTACPARRRAISRALRAPASHTASGSSVQKPRPKPCPRRPRQPHRRPRPSQHQLPCRRRACCRRKPRCRRRNAGRFNKRCIALTITKGL